MTIKHSQASRAVAGFNRSAKTVANTFTMDDDGEFLHKADESKTFKLVYPLDNEPTGWYIAATFSSVIGFPEMIRIRSTNWRAEDEPNGLYALEDARRFYGDLLKAGLKREES